MIRIAVGGASLGLVLALALAMPAMAQVKAGKTPERFDAADANHDGKVDRGEYDGFVEELVLIYDADLDGKLSRSEVATASDPSKFDIIDADKDGTLTITEIAAYSDNDFGAMDRNKDGAIDRAEATAFK